MELSVPFRMTPGLSRIPQDHRWLTPTAPGSRHQREKLAVLSRFRSQSLLCDAGFDPQPALAAVLEAVSRDHPQDFVWDGQTLICPKQAIRLDGHQVQQLSNATYGLGDEVLRCVQSLEQPWRLAGLLSLCIEEDLAIVQSSDSRLRWMAVALPSRWAPEDKIGKTFAEVHEPVAEAQHLRHNGLALMKMVCGSPALARSVWSISPEPWLHAHPARLDPEGWHKGSESPIPDRAWMRMEDQSFLPLPSRGQAVFAIRVRVEPLAQAVDSVLVAQRLHDSIASMSEEVLRYKGLLAVREPILRWLRWRCDSSP